jgi:riboflavin kinase/FMN adenylyltransferase
VPAFGVYATRVYHDEHPGALGIENIGVTNIGVRPTVDSSENITAETHILDFQRNLYGHKVRIEFYSRLRPEIKFNNVNDLQRQIKKDCVAAAEFFNSYCTTNPYYDII